MSHHRLITSLALAMVASIAGLAPALAAAPTTNTRLDCGADVSVRLYSDEAMMDLVDTFTFGTVRATWTTLRQANRSDLDIAVPATGAIEVVGTVTGRSYLFRLAIDIDDASPSRDGFRSRTRQDWLVTTPDGRLISQFSGQNISAFIAGHVALSKAHGRSRGLYLAGEWFIGCGGAINAPSAVPPPDFGDPFPAGDGSDITYSIESRYNGAFAANPRGLVPATTTDGAVDQDPDKSFLAGGPGTTSFDVVVPAGTSVVRFALFDDFTVGASDLDFYVHLDPGGADALIGESTGETAREALFLVDPIPGLYRVWVHGYSVESSPATFTLFHWVLGTGDAGNMTVTAPSEVEQDQLYPITLSFSGLEPGTAYLGSVAYQTFLGTQQQTVVLVTTP